MLNVGLQIHVRYVADVYDEGLPSATHSRQWHTEAHDAREEKGYELIT